MIDIRPLNRACNATLTIPGSKSYTHRALIISALGRGESFLDNPLCCEDTEYTIQALEGFGIPILRERGGVRVFGKGGELRSEETRIFLGNSGTSMRLLTALAALNRGRTLLDGADRMKERPIASLLSGLEALGVRAYSLNGNGCPPVIISSQGLRGGVTTVRSDESSQFLSALLLVAPYAERDVELNVIGHLASQPYVDVTLDIMSAFGVEVKRKGYDSFSVGAGQSYVARSYRIEGDASNASYFFSAAAVTRGRVRVENFRPTSVQGDAGFLAILENMGCEVSRGMDWTEVKGNELRGIEIDMNRMPDLVPTLAVTAAFARGRTLITNIGHLRLKESDRITAVAQELKRMGIRVEEGNDWLAIEGGNGAHGAEIDTHNDHRLAMSFAIAGLVVPGVKINEERCVEKSFPDFWGSLSGLYGG